MKVEPFWWETIGILRLPAVATRLCYQLPCNLWFASKRVKCRLHKNGEQEPTGEVKKEGNIRLSGLSEETLRRSDRHRLQN